MSQKDNTEQEAMAIAVNGVHAEFIRVCCISQFVTLHMYFNLLGRNCELLNDSQRLVS